MAGCFYCGEPLDPEQARKYPDCPAGLHVECAIRMTAGSEAHQTYRCACYGGTEEHDRPGETLRQDAIRAFRAWEGRHGRN
jgi:hypothetical protein